MIYTTAPGKLPDNSETHQWLPVLDDPALGLIVRAADPDEVYLAWPIMGAITFGFWTPIFYIEDITDFKIDGVIYNAVTYTAQIHRQLLKLRDALTDLPYRHPRLQQLTLEMPA